MNLLEAIKLDNYKIGPCQAIIYNRKETAIFKEGFLGELYWMFRGERYSTRDGYGILNALFCGMQDLSFDSIVAYLSTRPLCILGVWEEDEFKVAGICFPAVTIGAGDGNPKAAFAGYGYVRWAWGHEHLETLTLLGIAILFQELDILSLHGMRYASNDLTAKLMGKFGFKDVGTIPNYMMRGKELVAGTVSTLSRETFEENVGQRMLAAYEKNQQGEKS